MNTTSKRQKAGLALAGFCSAVNIVGVLFPPPDGQEGPPMGILVVDSVLGLVGLVAVIVTWRTGNRAAQRVAAGAIIIMTLTALPAFFVDVPAVLKLLVGVAVLLTIAAVVLMFSPGRRSTPVLD
ncbi:hypothetical protein J7E83_11730 [Arthrobacter sp. ISL-48]|uniref:hypothetical protein n=1 Tax=Arthrobacter sp. ISL-48 TaxID=2819110 RepID=UPI001BECBDCA|nr:hypothetical protein [Arthrobacter sp. ISL-48]MBT2532780.1 hypothetical protein [Arthrobacter sp. ISL-48]